MVILGSTCSPKRGGNIQPPPENDGEHPQVAFRIPRYAKTACCASCCASASPNFKSPRLTFRKGDFHEPSTPVPPSPFHRSLEIVLSACALFVLALSAHASDHRGAFTEEFHQTYALTPDGRVETR